MALFTWVTVSACCALVVLLVRRHRRKQAEFWPSHGFPTVDTSKILGNFFVRLLFRSKSIREVDEAVYAKVKGEMRVPGAGMSILRLHRLFITDLELAKRVLVKDADYFLSRQKISSLKDTDPLFAQMLFFMEGEEWKDLRTKMTPTFTTGKIKRMFHVFETSSQKLVEYLTSEAQADKSQSVAGAGDVELLDACGRYTMDVIASAAFGIDAKTFAEEDPIFTRMGKRLQLTPNFKFLLVFLLNNIAPKLASVLKIGFVDKEMQAFYKQVVLSAIRHRESTGDRRDDFLQLMLDVRSGQLKDDDDESGRKTYSGRMELTDDVLVAQSMLFIIAGFDTTQTLLVFALYELAVNPDVQEKLHAEVEQSWTKSGGGFNYEAVNQLEYLEKVVQETLRKYPPITRLERVAMRDYHIPDTKLVIPKGAHVLIPAFCIHRDEEYFPDANKFDPERFSPESKAVRHPYAFQAFGHGPRNCIGMRFALVNAKMAIATLVHNFCFEPCSQTQIPVEFEKTNFLKPKGGLRLKVTRRVGLTA